MLLTAFWTAIAWTDLAALRLPHADDMLRLASLRDWLDGQGFADPVQQRLGPLGGTALLWSRLPELVPAFLIEALSPLMGATRAEIAAVIFWPELLLFAHLLLVAALARRLGGAGAMSVTLLVAALAYPAIDLFQPGRIAEAGLQLVLVEALVLALVTGRMVGAGLAAGLSLLVGIAAAPVMLAASLWLVVHWVREARRLEGFGAGLLLTGLFGLVALRPQLWPADRCDGFTPPLLVLMMLGAGLCLVLAGLAPRLPDRRWRAAAALLGGALVLAIGWLTAPACFVLASGSAWPEPFAGSGSILGQPIGLALGLLGTALAGLGASIWLWRDQTEAASLFAVAIGAAVLAALIDQRSAVFAAGLAAPVLALLILRTQTRGVAWQVAAWLASMGLLWQAVGDFGARGAAAATGCTDRRTLAALDRLDAGTFAAPMELSAALIGATQHRSLGGPTARNQAGNRALAELFRSGPESAAYQASLWGVHYVALCASDSGGLPAALRGPGSLADHLLNDAAPAWLDPVSLVGSDLLIWRVQAVAAPGRRP